MSTALSAQIEPAVMRWPASLYHQMADLGWFRGKRVELIRGEIIVMSPMGSPHWVVVNLVADCLRATYAQDQFVVTEQCPISLGDDSEPEPDVAVIKGKARDFSEHLPTHCELVVEVSDSSLSFDRSSKAALYAEAGIPEYWIVDVNGRSVDVLTEPVLTESGAGYRDHATVSEGGLLLPRSAPGSVIRVADILP